MRRKPIGFVFLFLAAMTGRLFSQESAVTITPSVAPGPYATDQQVSIVTDTEAELFFTFEESRDQQFTRYTVPITLTALPDETRLYTLRVEARSGDTVLKKKEFSYRIDKSIPDVPEPTVPPGTYRSPVRISFTEDSIGADQTLFLLTDQSQSDTPKAFEGNEIVFFGVDGERTSHEIRAFVTDGAGNTSRVASFLYLLDRRPVELPEELRILSPAPGEFANPQYLMIEDEGFASITYTLNGEDPRTNGAAYSQPFLIDISGHVDLRAVGTVEGSGEEFESRVVYQVTGRGDQPFQPQSGIYDEEVLIEFDSDQSVVYTLDDQPTLTRGLAYRQPIRLRLLPGSIRTAAVRFSTNGNWPEYRHFYVLDDRTPEEPRISLSEDPPVNRAPSVTIDAPEFLSVHYTTDGTTPDRNDSVYELPFVLGIPENREVGSIIVKAVSIGDNGRASRVATSLITYDLVPPEKPEISRLGKSSRAGITVGVESEFGTTVHYELTLDDTTPPTPGFQSPVISGLLNLEVPYGMERMFALRFTAVDSAGNLSEPTEPFRLLVDRVPPATPEIRTTAAGFEVTGSGSIHWETTTDGTLPPIPTRRSPTYTDPVPIASRPDTRVTTMIRAIAVDTSGNVSPPTPVVSATIDTRTPRLPNIVGVTDGASYNSAVTISLRPEPEGFEVAYEVTTGEETPEVSATSPAMANLLRLEGVAHDVVTYTVALAPRTPDGVLSASIKLLTFTIDREPPDIPTIEGLAGTEIRNTAIDLTPPMDYEDVLYYAIASENGTPDPFGPEGEPFFLPITLDSDPGTQKTFLFRLGAEDAAGNRVVDPVTHRITIDRQSPRLPRISGAPPTGISREAVSLELTGEAGTIRYVISEDATLPQRDDREQLYRGPFVIDVDSGKTATFTIRYYALDDAGNASVDGYARFTIDKDPPADPPPPNLVSIAEDQLILDWKQSRDAPIYYRLAGGGTSAFAPIRGPVVIPRSTDMNTTVFYYARDRAGNQSQIQEYRISAPSSASASLVSGVADGHTYNSRKRLVRRQEGGVIRYLLRDDGKDPGLVTPYSPVMPQYLDFDAEIGETHQYVLSFGWYPSAKDTVPLRTETIRFNIDRNPPPAPELVLDGAGRYSRQDLTIEMSADEGEIYYSLNDASFVRYAETVALTAKEGEIRTFDIRAYAKDEADNRSLETSSWSIVIDKSDIYVSVAGNDLYDGSRIRPFRTLERAVREAQQTQRKTINISSGTYLLRSPISIGGNLTIRGGLDSDTWNADGQRGITSIASAPGLSATSMLEVKAASLTIEHVQFNLVEASETNGVISAVDADLVLQSVRIDAVGVRTAPLIKLVDSDVQFEATSVVGPVVDAPVIEIERADVVHARESIFVAQDVSGDSTVLRVANSADVRVTDSSIRGGRARSATALSADESNITLERARIRAGAGRTSGTGIALFDTSLRVMDSDIVTDEGSWISACIDAQFSNIIIENTELIARGNRGAIAVSADGTTIDVNRSVIRGDTGKEFLYLFQLSNAQGSIVNSMLTTGSSRDLIILDLERAPIALYHDSILLGEATNLEIAIRVQDDNPPAVVNSLIASTAGGADPGRSVAISFVGRPLSPRLLGNAFGGFRAIVEYPGRTLVTTEDVNHILDGDPEGGRVQLNRTVDPATDISLGPDAVIRPTTGSALIDAGIDLNLIGLRVSIDFDGETRPGAFSPNGGFDIGADEIQ